MFRSLFVAVSRGTRPMLAAALLLLAIAVDATAEERAAGKPLATAAVAKSAAAPGPGLFGTQEIRSANMKAFKKWRSVLRRYRGERHLEKKPCTDRVCPLRHWRDFLTSLRSRDARYQINAVNRYMNAVRYISDRRNNGATDYWSTPREFLGRGGDCEDYAIAKYLSLRALGFDPNAMRIVVLQDMSRNLAHAVLVLHQQGERLVLDNQLKMVVAARKIRHYRPYYSINESYWWRHKKPSGRPVSKPAGPAVVAQRNAS